MATTPVLVDLNCVFPDGEWEANTNNMGSWPASYTVPAAKRLTVETISTAAFIPKDQHLHGWIYAEAPSLPYDHYLQMPLQFQATIRDVDLEYRDHYSMNSVVRAYFGPGSQLSAEGKRDANTGKGWVHVTIEGVLEDI
jgi:hypothetical protein